MKPDELAQEIVKRSDKCRSDRATWESHWEEVAERVMPSLAGSFLTDSLGLQTPGEKRTDKMLDATAASANFRFASVMDSTITPRNARWHSLRPTDPKLARNREVRVYFEQVTDILFRHRYAPMANFASQNHENFLALGAFGTGCLFTDPLRTPDGRTNGLRYRAIHLAEVSFQENHQGIIDTAYRTFKLTARQAAQQFRLEELPKQIVEKLNTQNAKEAEQEFEFVHAVVPRTDDYDPDRLDAKGKPWASYYVCKTTQTMVREGGYSTFPYAISRYATAPGELYGRSPAMMALPSIKVLNEQKATVLKQGHRAVDPVYLLADDGVLDGFSTKPGSLNYGGVTAEGRSLVQALPVGNIAVGKDLMDDERAVINDMFLVTLFQILVDTPQMTATEVLERAREKGALLSPTMGRQQSEYLAPLIDRELDILAAQGLLPPMPRILREARGDYEVIYDSPLSRMQRSEETAGALRLFQTATEFAAQTQNPEPLDWFDFDTMMPALADNFGMRAEWMRSAEAVQAIRQNRAAAARQQAMIQALPGMAAMAKATQGQ